MKGGGQWSAAFLVGLRASHRRQHSMVILHSLARCVEQLCARSADSPTLENVRPRFCVFCGQAARNADGVLQVVGHGMYSRQVCGLIETGWIVIWVRRFLCLVCGHTMSLLPDWLHPWRWYAGTAIIEALYRHCVLLEPASEISARFGLHPSTTQWRSLRRWRRQLLISPTLWGWLGPRLGVTEPASNRLEGKIHVERLLAEAGLVYQSSFETFEDVCSAVHRTLRDLIHNRKKAWPLRHFLPGISALGIPGRNRHTLSTEKDSGPGPPL